MGRKKVRRRRALKDEVRLSWAWRAAAHLFPLFFPRRCEDIYLCGAPFPSSTTKADRVPSSHSSPRGGPTGSGALHHTCASRGILEREGKPQKHFKLCKSISNFVPKNILHERRERAVVWCGDSSTSTSPSTSSTNHTKDVTVISPPVVYHVRGRYGPFIVSLSRQQKKRQPGESTSSDEAGGGDRQALRGFKGRDAAGGARRRRRRAGRDGGEA